MDWRERGKKDFRDGVPRVAAPNSQDTSAGGAWRRGWDEAAGEAERQGIEVTEVALVLRAGRLYLVDAAGRVLGTQTSIVIEQNDEGLAAAVTFTGLRLTTA